MYDNDTIKSEITEGSKSVPASLKTVENHPAPIETVSLPTKIETQPMENKLVRLKIAKLELNWTDAVCTLLKHTKQIFISAELLGLPADDLETPSLDLKSSTDVINIDFHKGILY